MKLCSIASSSEGNCIYAGSGEHHFLIDIGISRVRVVEGLASIGVKPEQIDGIFITHEHSDHVKGLAVWMKKNPVPVFATSETFCAIFRSKNAPWIPEEYLRAVEPDQQVQVGDTLVVPFSISHDAANPVGYHMTDAEGKIAVATDLGEYTDYTVEHLKGTNVLLLESNHDINMVEVGKYPYNLKRRILGARGHLSNDNAGRLITEIYHPGLRKVLLGHLSKENNFDELAYQTVRYELDRGNKPEFKQLSVSVANRVSPSKVYNSC